MMEFGHLGSKVAAGEVALGVDIGGGSTKIGLVTREGDVLDRKTVVPQAGDNAEEILERFVEAIRQLMKDTSAKPLGIGVGFPGPINTGNRSGTLNNVPALDDFPIADWLERKLGMPTRLENDAAAAGLGEAMFGAHKDFARQLLVVGGTGIGVAFTVDGHPMATSGGCLGDIGHTIVVFEEPLPCRQGCLGCLESVASGDALGRRLLDYAVANPNSEIVRHAVAAGRRPTVQDLIVCALEGDADAVAFLVEAGRWIGRAVATWSHIFAPNVVLLGGGMSAAGNLLLSSVESEARKYGLKFYFDKMQFALASLGNDAGLVGSAAQVFLHLDSFRSDRATVLS